MTLIYSDLDNNFVLQITLNTNQQYMIVKSIILTAAAAAVAITSHAEIDCTRLYLTGEATPAGWSENLPEELIPVGGNCFVWDGWLNTGEFKFINTRGDWGSSIVADSYNLSIDTEGPYRLVDNTGANSNPDWKFYNNRPGYVRIIADLGNMSVKFRRPATGIVGEAALGWGNLQDVLIPVFADDEGRISWTGLLRCGEVKFLGDGAGDWHPCYNAPWEGCVLDNGGHWLKYNVTDADDYKYMVVTPGLYTLEFDLGDRAGDGSLKVTRADAPDLTGAFAALPGRYMVAYDRHDMRLHFGPVPTRLYLTAYLDDTCVEFQQTAPGVFSTKASMRAGDYYKLCYSAEQPELTAISPNADTMLTPDGTANLSPMHGYSYTVPEDGEYTLTADFSGTMPMLRAERMFLTGIDNILGTPATVSVDDRTIIVSGCFTEADAYTPAGVLVASGARMSVTPGIYIVKVDNLTFKIAVR